MSRTENTKPRNEWVLTGSIELNIQASHGFILRANPYISTMIINVKKQFCKGENKAI